jgi:hypothetical protein
MERFMATIVIKDLPENVDLDREAMLAIVGGARLQGGHHFRARRMSGGARVVTFASGGTAPAATSPAKPRSGLHGTTVGKS